MCSMLEPASHKTRITGKSTGSNRGASRAWDSSGMAPRMRFVNLGGNDCALARPRLKAASANPADENGLLSLVL